MPTSFSHPISLALVRTLRYMWFLLQEYQRSWRILIEAVSFFVIYYLFLRQASADGITATYFFHLMAALIPLSSIYTTSMLLNLVDKPQSYLIVVSRISRTNFLLAIFLAAQMLAWGFYLLISLAVRLFNWPNDLDLGGWLTGSLPLLANTALVSTIMIFISALVIATHWRLLILGLFAIALSGNFLPGTLLAELPESLRAILSALQALLGAPLVPIIYGYQLSASQDLGNPTAIGNLVAQVLLTIAFMMLTIYAFQRRDISFSR